MEEKTKYILALVLVNAMAIFAMYMIWLTCSKIDEEYATYALGYGIGFSGVILGFIDIVSIGWLITWKEKIKGD